MWTLMTMDNSAAYEKMLFLFHWKGINIPRMMFGEWLQASLWLMEWKSAFIEVFGCFISKSNTKAVKKYMIWRFIMLMLQTTMQSGPLARTGRPINQAAFTVNKESDYKTGSLFAGCSRKKTQKTVLWGQEVKSENSTTHGGGGGGIIWELHKKEKIPKIGCSFTVTETEYWEWSRGFNWDRDRMGIEKQFVQEISGRLQTSGSLTRGFLLEELKGNLTCWSKDV